MVSRNARTTIAAITAVSLSSISIGQAIPSPDGPDAVNRLRTLAPSLRTHTNQLDKMVNTRLYGARMLSSRVSAEDAATRFLTRHSEALGVKGAEFEQVRRVESSSKNETIFHYKQRIGGLPVENSHARLVVKTGAENSVVYAAGRLAPEPAGGLAPPTVEAADAVFRVQADIAYKRLPIWHDDEVVLVAYYNEDADETTLAWTFQGGSDLRDPNGAAFTFFVDAYTAEILEARSAVYTADIPVTATGFGTPGNGADVPGSEPVEMPIRNLIILNEDTFGENAVTDENGLALVPNSSGVFNANVSGSFENGLWLNINDATQPSLFETGNFVEGIGGNLVFNAVPNEFDTAQVNTFIHTNLIHDFMNTYAPGLTGVDIQIDANVNQPDVFGFTACNAVFSDFGGFSINFLTAGTDPFSGLQCNNTAFSSVVAHEYGHFIVNRLGLGQGEFGEGYGDTCSMLLYDDPVIGRDFRVDGGIVRDPVNSGLSFPCSPGPSVHFCGQVLGGLWWDIRENLGASLGDAAGLEAARVLFGNWSLITSGGVSGQAVHPATAIELLVADDDDGNIDNGTPNYDAICAALSNRGVDCPPLALLSLNSEADADGIVPTNQAIPVSMTVEEVTSETNEASGLLFVSVEGGPFVSSPLTTTDGETFTGAIPATECAQTVEYYFSIEDISGQIITEPDDAPISTFEVFTAESTQITYETTFEVDAAGFTAGLPGDTATTGQWERGDPNGTVAQPENDNTPFSGVNCFFTGQAAAGEGQGTNDVDDGFTTLLSPEIDLTMFDEAIISYFRWYRNDTGDSPNADTFRVDIRLAGDSVWQSVEVVGPSGPGTTGGWIPTSFEVSELIPLPATVQLRFIAEDAGNGSIVEAAIDDVSVNGISCVAVETCAGDCDGSGSVDFADLVTMLGAFGTSPFGTGCDPDSSGVVDFGDLVSALSLFGPCE